MDQRLDPPASGTTQSAALAAEGLDAARQARVLVAISFHFAASRAAYLFEVLSSLADYLVERMEVVLFTNTAADDDARLMLSMGQALFPEPGGFTVMCATALRHPYLLTWTHKAMIRDKFLGARDYTHFIYLEDDVRLTFSGFTYFLAARPYLAAHGLLPGFVRYEYHSNWDGVLITDQRRSNRAAGRPRIAGGDTLFMPPDNPYQGMYILDQALAAEYVLSPSFDPIASELVQRWDVRERAAMGLTFEAVPQGFSSRLAIPVSSRTMEPLRCAWVHHLANTYAHMRDPGHPGEFFASLPMRDFFC